MMGLMDYFSTALIVGGYLLTLFLVPYVFFQTRKQPVSTLAWITAIVTLPYLGAHCFSSWAAIASSGGPR